MLDAYAGRRRRISCTILHLTPRPHMHLDRRTVSRKTPRDGKLEISAGAAAQLQLSGSDLRAHWKSESAAASLSTMRCSCGGGDTQHEHFFLESEIFRGLPVGEEVE